MGGGVQDHSPYAIRVGGVQFLQSVTRCVTTFVSGSQAAGYAIFAEFDAMRRDICVVRKVFRRCENFFRNENRHLRKCETFFADAIFVPSS